MPPSDPPAPDTRPGSGPDPERDRLSGRVRRFAQVGAGLAGAGAQLSANSLFGGSDADARNARALKAALGQL